MRLRPLGWELGFLLVVVAVLAVGLVVGSTPLILVSVLACAVAAPVVVASFVVRLIAGILDETRRRRTVPTLD